MTITWHWAAPDSLERHRGLVEHCPTCTHVAPQTPEVPPS